ncbi:hypothetical protein [Nonomuraea sp. NPDC023979]|uniref:hypothetical protein n=1 Tax=Nonomuraea sp. NPDC023979 TaxID=3154796 RepID=UPI0033F42AF2
MKFEDGHWRMRPGTRGAYAHAAHDVTADGGTLRVRARRTEGAPVRWNLAIAGVTHPGVRVTADGDTDQIEIVLTTEE